MKKLKEILSYSINITDDIHLDVKTILFVILVFFFTGLFEQCRAGLGGTVRVYHGVLVKLEHTLPFTQTPLPLGCPIRNQGGQISSTAEASAPCTHPLSSTLVVNH